MIGSIRFAAVVVLFAALSTPLAAREGPAPARAGEEQAEPGAPHPASVPAADVARRLAGVWKAPEDRMERYNQLDIDVFGPHAVDIRNVDLTIQPSGEGVLQISTKVVDQKGRIYAPSVVEAQLRIGSAETTVVGLVQPAVTVVTAVERYLDGSGDRWSRDGSRIKLTTTELGGDELNFRWEPSTGRGSFAATLKRQRARAPKR
jgi:hypothetical protein